MAGVMSSSWPQRIAVRREWLVAAVGLLLMYGPTYWSAAHSIWTTDDHGHGPIILAVLVWLYWKVAPAIETALTKPVGLLGWPLLVLGLLMYILGRGLGMSSVEFASHLPVFTGLLLLLRGKEAVRVAWFPLLYLVFFIPLPGIFVDAITGPLKQWISDIVQHALYSVGYPIARTGVIISIGQYQLLVADACSGLHSMFSLAALGTLFMYIMNRPSKIHNTVMMLSIIPIAFTANIIRVIVLVLVTYHLGDEAGQGFLHGTAGMVLMLAALLFFFLLDNVLAFLLKPRGAESSLH